MLGVVRSKINRIAVTKGPRVLSTRIYNINRPVFSQHANGLHTTFAKRNFFWSSSKEPEVKVEEPAAVVIEDVKEPEKIVQEEPAVQNAEPVVIDSVEDKGTLFESVIQEAELPKMEVNRVLDENINMRWYCDNDLGGVLGAIAPTNQNNILEGGSTYGFWESLACLDDFFYNEWMYVAEDLGLGIGFGLLVVSFSVRFAFIPLAIYSQITGIKIKLLTPDQEQITELMKRHMKTGNKEGSKLEREKLKRLRAQHGIYPSISLLNVLQFPIHVVFISMINRLSYNYDIKPAILTDGFLWFKDLSSPDPFGVLPVVGGTITLLNILSTSTGNINPTMRRMRKYMYFLPCLTIPIWMTFPSAFNLYWMTTSLVQLIILNLFRSMKFRNFLGIPRYLPGTKLEKMNMKAAKEYVKFDDLVKK